MMAALRNDPTWNPPRVTITIGVFTLAQAEPGPPMRTGYIVDDEQGRVGLITLYRDCIVFAPDRDRGPILSQAQIDAVARAILTEDRRRHESANSLGAI